eukprot:CAMPEP_0115070350 /NCGR_PEP_ID=MMETSP0227-20121206/13064_1 /TAXON_ID=89957 /ORGANISM="Polarella glacialis, Strain CCMP 1383" /LENGTH=323 /DNA_ID=CAMNT_0002456853 /DNA_START=57 /DNA_END=1025 /DNA_ORIENTATION=+
MVAAIQTAEVRPAGLQVQLFDDQVFGELRASAQVPDDFVNSGWDFGTLKPGGGKGGGLMARVGDGYLVKELSKGDHQVLLQIAGSYARHVRSGDTLICPIYLHFQDVASGRFFFAMRNSVGRGPFKALYDLKGCADDKLLERDGCPLEAVHKRIWNVGMWCGQTGWSEKRKLYYEGKVEARSVEIVMAKDQREAFLLTLQRDTDWLAGHRLMDYSLLVGIKEEAGPKTASGGLGPAALGHRPLTRQGEDGKDIVLLVSIIDFLQLWTNGKKCARCCKSMEWNKATIPPVPYARRFASHFAKRTLVATAEPEAGVLEVVNQHLA